MPNQLPDGSSLPTLESATWQRVKTICADALERDAGEREALVAERCGEDVELRREVLRLLAAHERAEPGFLEQPTGGPLEAAITSRIGQRFGPWELVEELGTGGMGVVYLARRREADFEQQAALKVMRLAGDAGLTERFQRERQVLAGLEHPNIAHLLDGGTTDEGVPYFAMEYVEGRPIDRYCDEEELSTSERLDLFLEVCAAVGHAHRNLVVHRDLKPSNIVVTAEGRPKLLDFGIAKLLAEGPGDATVTSFQALTPNYASPEQLEGRAITTASDVYALGMLLFRLLAGSTPFAAETKSLPELARERREPPPRPSTLVDPGTARRLEGDLDAIVLKALRPEPEQRYGSVDALAEDLARHCDGLPVGARHGTFAYLLGKFVRRHKAAVGAAALVALTLVGATAVSTRAARIARAERATAESERAKAERISGFLQSMITSPTASWFAKGKGRDVTVVQVLEEAEESLETEDDLQLPEEAMIRRTLGVTYRGLGLYEASERLLRDAVRLDEQSGGDTSYDYGLSVALLAMTLYRQGEYAEAEELYRRSIDIFRVQPARSGIELSGNIGNLGLLLLEQGKSEEAEPHLREALALGIERLGDDDPSVALILNSLGNLSLSRGELEQAKDFYERALASFRALPGINLEMIFPLATLGLVETFRGEHAEAEDYLREARLTAVSQLGEEHPFSAIVDGFIAHLSYRRGEPATAERQVRSALQILEPALGEGHLEVARARTLLGRILTALGMPEEAVGHLQSALDRRREALPTSDWRIAEASAALGDCIAALGRTAEAEPLLAEGAAGLEATLGPGHLLTREAREQLRDVRSTLAGSSR